MKIIIKKMLAYTLAFSMAFVSCGFDVFAASSKVSVAEDRVYITSTQYDLVPGANEIVLTTNNESGTDQRIGFVMKVDADALKDGSIKVVATYKDYQYDTFGMQTVTDQAAAYERKHEGETAFAGVNASFYNMTTGEPSGLFIMDGKVCNSSFAGRGYFAILNDGTAVIREPNTDYSDVKEAVAGAAGLLVKDGQYVETLDDYAIVKYSRAAIGVTADGDIITYVTHGISAPTSCGETFKDVAEALIALGCDRAIMLDGGGSATYASKREGTDELTVVNNPSDGTPRTVSNALIFVSTLASTGEFDHASIEPNNGYYTPTLGDSKTTVQFEAKGIDASGSSAELPQTGLSWALAEDSISLGTIDKTTGLFTGAKNAVGTVNVNLLYENEVVGTTSIKLVEPDEIYFESSGVSLNFNDETDLGFTVKGEGVKLNIKDGDFDWAIESTLNDVSDSLIGRMKGNIFVAGSKQEFALEGTATASYKRQDGKVLTASIILEIGKMPIVMMDFEDISGNRGKEVVGLWDWGAKSTWFTDASDNQVYDFKDYDILYYMQSTTYSGDSAWINEVYRTSQPWIEHEDGTITYTFEGVEYTCTKEETYGQHGQKWVSFTDNKGAGYYWRGYVDGSTWTGNFNAGGGSASAILAADDYDLYVWHTNANPTTLANGVLHGEGSKIVDATEGEVRFGEHALKLTYDYRNFSPTGSTKNCNTYYRMTNPLVASGSPTGLGMWVYAPEAMDNFWFWTAISYWDGSSWQTAYPHFKPVGAEKSLQFTGINWTGWMYVEADLSAVYAAGAQVDAEHPLQVRSGNALIQMTYIPGGSSDGEGHSIVMGSRTAGHFYIDNVRWVYGTNVDDMDAPEILNVVANETQLKTDEIVNVGSNEITFTVDFTDPQGENYSGIDETATQIYLDGKVLASDKYSASADKLQTVPMNLANGEHTLKVSICDNFGNKTEKTYKIVVANENSEIPAITIDRNEKAELGADYEIVISADSLDKIASISTQISYFDVDSLESIKYLSNSQFYDDYGNALTLGSDGLYYDANGTLVEEPVRPSASGNYSISNAVQVLGENLTGKIRNKLASADERVFTASATVNSNVNDDTTLLTFSLPLPNNLTENDKFSYVVTVTYTTTNGETYTVTSGEENAPVYAYYEITSGIHIAGAENSTLTINATSGEEVDTTNVQIYVGDTLIDGTFEGNVFTSEYFVGLDAKTTVNGVRVVNDVDKHYSYNTSVFIDSEASVKESLHYDLTLNATTGDSATTENISWFAHTSTVNKAIVEYMTLDAYNEAYKAAYEAALEAAEGNEEVVDVNAVINTVFKEATIVEGTSKLTHFGSDLVAVYINNVKISGLNEATTYAYRAGDGESWSTVHEFSTMKNDETTKFVVVADAQLLGDGGAGDQAAIAVLERIAEATKAVDFGIQTGDFVDGGITYYQWDQILGVWEDQFVGKDFVHVIGNHETYGTAGSSISSAIFGLNKSEVDYYSVEYGDIYVAVINQTADLIEAAKWLEEDASQTDCTWKVLTCHQPIYYTNPNGSSQGHHKQLKVACDKAGIDFTFSGHDHSYARTMQMLDGVPVNYAIDSTSNSYVDENGELINTQGLGTVYYICGDLGEKSRSSEYAIVNNPDFNFAFTSQEYDALYLTVEASKYYFTVNTWNLKDDATELHDTFTMYTAAGICNEQESHKLTMNEAIYDPTTSMLICERCGENVDPQEVKYTGFVTNINGADSYGDSQYYFLAGAIRTGFFTVGEDIWYANEEGLIDHATENMYTNTCTENGKHHAYSPRYDETYVGSGTVKFDGHKYVEQENGSLKCEVCDHIAIDVADWTYSLSFTSTNYTGKAKTPAISIQNPETGEKLEFATDGMGRLTDYKRTWLNNVEIGTATVTISINPVGDYTNSKGDVVLELRINPVLPENVVLNEITQTTAKLSWDAAEKAEGYNVYKWEDKTWKLAGTTTDTSIELTNLNSSTKYQFAVKSFVEVDREIYESVGLDNKVSGTTLEGNKISGWNTKLNWTKTTYNGNAKRPGVTVTDSQGNVLVKNKDYSVTYENNVNAGTATVIVKGLGVNVGKVTTNFTINQQDLSAGKVVLEKESYAYTEKNIVPNMIVTDKNGYELVQDIDYTLAVENNVNPGTASIKISGIGNYKGALETSFVIEKANLENTTVTLSYEEVEFSGGYKKPVVTVKTEDGTTLILDKNYTVTYKNNKNVGTATVTVTGIDNYEGTQTLEFTITPRNINICDITLDKTAFNYTGEEIKPIVKVVTPAGTTLKEGVSYSVVYNNNVEVGTATVTVNGLGNYGDSKVLEFTIAEKDAVLEKEEIVAANVKVNFTKATYNGNAKRPGVNVTNSNGEKLVKGVDYTVVYENNVEIGKGKIIITGIGNYTGIVEKTLTICPPTATNLGVVKATSSTIKVSFDRNELADKYYIYVNGKYKGAALTVDYYTIKGLEAGTTYEISVKAVKVVNGTNIYSINNPAIEASTK